jgi:hypothetical protein
MKLKYENSWYVYRITRCSSGKSYIGQHHKELNEDIYSWKYQGSGYSLKKAIKKYGLKEFKKEIIVKDIPSKEIANTLEVWFIGFYDTLRNGYNSTIGGDGMIDPTGEIGKKISKSLKGKLSGPNNGMFGKNPFKDKSPEELKRIFKERDNSNRGQKSVVCLNTMKVFSSIGKACEEYNLGSSIISKSCNNPVIHGKGLYFEYYDITKSYEGLLKKRIEARNNNKFKACSKAGKIGGQKTHRKGYHHYNDGKSSIQSYDCPEGFFPGRILKR